MKPRLPALLLALACAVLGRAGESPRPHILFVMADDMGWGQTGYRGHPVLKTPHLDAMAANGLRFERFYAGGPVCSPTRATVMTGRSHDRTGAISHGYPLRLQERTVAQGLKAAGYVTGHFGKWHLTNRQTPGAPRPEAYGIDEWAVFNGGAGWPAAKVGESATHAVDFIRRHRDRPFFLNVWLHETHTPHAPSPEAMAQWAHLDAQRRVYAAVVTDGDRAVGRILKALREAGVDGNTLVLFSSDNGPENTGATQRPAYTEGDSGVTGYDTYYSVGETGGLRGRKRSLFEGGVRVPFLVRWPGRAPAGRRDETTVFTAVDLLPTLCAAAGVTLPADYAGDGENLLPALLGEPVARTRPVFWEWRGNATEPDWWPRLAVRDGGWKLLLTADAGRVSLHRLPEDRAEARDVAAENPAVVARLSRLALDWRATLPSAPPADCFAPADQVAPPPETAKKAPARKGKAGQP